MPLIFPALFLLINTSSVVIKELVTKGFLSGHRRYNIDLLVSFLLINIRRSDWMDVKLRCRWLSREFTQTLDEFLLDVVVNLVLLAEEYHSTLSN